ncbi:GNAT family N-acetyltransferase [Streptomyces sp. C11-1]|uniref:GNAT family N-acetyltransferase n=1 Tax=Streptomyces durocortorensis TaxID=2811104 RepID=A0ABY9VXL9_9ACTN|nr:GNAT family N-acetyltransferase [Streptomyces durocortorensis]WNF26507.1 GNAT family N-acetyltransferase [Streptomyces durocortorensis]
MPAYVSGRTVIRRYAATDENASMDLWSRAGSLAHPFIPGEGEGERARKMREIYLVHAENWVAESNGRVVALLGLLDAEIGGLFVAPEAQGTGVGRRLVEHAAALHGSLTLEVYEKNTRARGFYARMGFVEQSRRVDEEYDEVMLRLIRPAPENPARSGATDGPARLRPGARPPVAPE